MRSSGRWIGSFNRPESLSLGFSQGKDFELGEKPGGSGPRQDPETRPERELEEESTFS